MPAAEAAARKSFLSFLAWFALPPSAVGALLSSTSHLVVFSASFAETLWPKRFVGTNINRQSAKERRESAFKRGLEELTFGRTGCISGSLWYRGLEVRLK